MEIKKPIDTLNSVDGFLCYMMQHETLTKVDQLEASMLCIDQPEYPIKSTIHQLSSGALNDPNATLNGYPCYTKAIKEHFNLPGSGSMVQKGLAIAFLLDNIEADQSRASGTSSWR